MRHVGIGHRRILAHDVHAADLAGVHGVHDLDDGQSRLRVERRAPDGFDHAARIAVVDAVVVGKHHRNQADIAGALHVVLTAQGMQPGAGAPDLPGHQGERNQAACIVGAMDVL